MKKKQQDVDMFFSEECLVFEMMGVPVFEYDGFADITEEGTQFKVFRWLLDDMEQYTDHWAVVGFTGDLHIYDEYGTQVFDGSLLDSRSFSEELKKLIDHRANLLEKAVKLAEDGHAGQMDKGGLPYIGHPIRVMEKCTTLESKIVAVMHDLLEDTSVTKEDLEAAGFPDEIIEAVVCITKKKGEEYMSYIERVAQNDLAAQVKLADLADNMRMERIPNPTEKDFKRQEKYKRAKERLEEILLTMI